MRIVFVAFCVFLCVGCQSLQDNTPECQSVQDRLNGCVERFVDYDSYTELLEIYYKDGKKYKEIKVFKGGARYETPYKNGKIEGIKRSYYETGVLSSEEPYTGDLLHGVAKHYYRSGRLKTEIPYDMGSKEGLLTEYYMNGRIQDIVLFKNDKMEGLRKAYYENGNRWFEVLYDNGKEKEDKTYYETSGKLESKWFVDENGVGVRHYYYENGAPLATFVYHNCVVQRQCANGKILTNDIQKIKYIIEACESNR